jgi:Cdc6-like AAA superfamily ATPase
MADHDENSAGNRMPTTAGAQKGPPIPSFGLPGNSNVNSTSSSDNSIASNSSSNPTFLGGDGTMLPQAVVETTALTQEAEPRRPLQEEDDSGDEHMDLDDDGSVSSGGGSLSSRGSGSSEDDSSSSDEEEEEEGVPLSLEERMVRNQQRNAEFLQSLNEKYQDQVPAELKPKPAAAAAAARKQRKKKSSSRLDEETPAEHGGGMLRHKPPSHHDVSTSLAATTTTTTTASIPLLAQRLHSLTRQYPYREGQIRHLTAMLHGSMGSGRGVVVQQNNQLVSSSSSLEAVHVPAPIFISGPRGAGKTSVVKDVLTMLEADNHHHQQQCPDRSTPRLHSAYINCVTLEPSSIERLVADAYKQLRPESSASSSGRHYGRRLRKRRQQTSTKLPHSPKPQNYHRVDALLTSNAAHETATTKEGGGGMSIATLPAAPLSESTATLPAAPLSDTTSSNEQAMTMGEEDLQQQHEQQPRLQPRRAAKVAAPGATANGATSTMTSTGRNKKANTAAAAGAKSHTAVEDDPHRTEDTVETSHSAVVAFGRSLQRYFGGGSQRAAVLVLDDAERLLTLSARKKTSDKANCLAELLLLPKVMRLNLTIVVISRYSLLYGTRLDNIASPDKSTATLSGSVGGLTIQFPAYKDHQVMKKVCYR